jgi:hypothetical protein
MNSSWRHARGVAALGVLIGSIVALAADTRVPPARTQAPADRLLDSAAVERAAERLAASDRVTVLTIGRSAGGRPIRMIAITAPGGSLDEWRRRAGAIAGPVVRYPSLARPLLDEVALDEALPSTRLPVLFAGASWGHEASQVEGLLAAAEYLASDRSPETDRVLNRLVVLIVPLMNPDGRDRAIAEWKRTPLSNGDAAVGNDRGFMLNRDFIHQTQPESRALLAVTREWRPVVGVDLHEDVNRLGLALPAVAFAPPFMPGFDVEEHPDTRRAVVAVGGAIAARWRTAGYPVVHDPGGERTWVPMPPRGSGELNPVAGSSGRLEFLWNIHGTAGLITESARTPGTQTWEARVDQKKLAALAAAGAVAADPAFFARALRGRRAVALHAERQAPFVAIPHAQPAGADRQELIRLLREHDVLVYRASGQMFDVIPLDQPEGDFVRHAVLAERSKLNDLPSALGVTIVRSDAMDAAARARLVDAALELYDAPPLVWPASPAPADVAVYAGQGVDRAASGEVMFVLGMAGFSTVALTEDDVRAGSFGTVRAVVFGDGAAREIIGGWDPSTATRKAPWQPAEASRGIGDDGMAALARFVRDGGRVVTIGRSAGVVAPSLIDVTLSHARPGIGEVRLDVTPAGRTLFAGTPFDAGGARAFLAAAPGGQDGGYLFKPAVAAQALAWYAGVVDRPAEQSFADTSSLARDSGHAAIVSAAVGKGRVFLFGFSPVFRAQWRATFPLLFNAAGGR